MIPSADTFLANKWERTNRGWYKLGVEIIEQEVLVFDTNCSFISIYFYLDPSHSMFASLYVRGSNIIETIENDIKIGIQNILQSKSYPITPKLKRTLKNWIL